MFVLRSRTNGATRLNCDIMLLHLFLFKSIKLSLAFGTNVEFQFGRG